MWTAEDSPSFDDGVYRGRLVELEEAAGGVDDKGYVKWTFELLDEEYEGQSLRANSSLNFGPRAKARGWAEALLGRRIQTGERVGEDDLIGKEADLMVRNVETDRGTFARVESVNPVRKKREKQDAQDGSSQEVKQKIEEDFEDIPW